MHPQLALNFADEVRRGLLSAGQKSLPTTYLYDDVGSALFDAITALPEYGLTRADLRLLKHYAADIARFCSGTSDLVELGSGNGSKARALMEAFPAGVIFRPVDISSTALEWCRRELAAFPVHPVEADFLTGLETAARTRSGGRILAAFLGSNIGNFRREDITPFLRQVHERLLPGDAFLLGADLVKPAADLILAYDDPAGVTAAFNRNLLSHVNRQLDGDFCVRCYDHEARWNENERRVEMHLRVRSDQRVSLRAIDLDFRIRAGETIWTESSHKFETGELTAMANLAGFSNLAVWTDAEWPFAELLFRA
jgi:dimethylhistidine N-methyltransferase